MVEIDDRKLKRRSADNFHDNYKIVSKIFENEDCIVFLGEDKNSGGNVAIKRFDCGDASDLEDIYLNEDGELEEYRVQNLAQCFQTEDCKAAVLGVSDWFVYDTYFVMVTDYEERFKHSLFDLTSDQAGGHFTEEKCKIIFKLILKLIVKLNNYDVYHLDVKPSNILYDPSAREMRLLDFGHSIIAEVYDPCLKFHCGTNGLRTPQQVEKSERFGRDVDLWGCAQVLYFCSQGDYAYEDDEEVLSKELEFKV